MQNMAQIFGLRKGSLGSDATTETEHNGVTDTVTRHLPLWEAWEKVSTGIHSTKKMTVTEQDALLADIKTFDELYEENIHDKTITIKMHQVFCYMEPVLRKYSTIGFFAKDGLESIHYVTHNYGRTF
jgi:hypothetical protein